MYNYSHWLVASDIDGTLNNKMRKMAMRNYDAIYRFTSELNGNFTLASARGVQSLKPHYDKLPNVKTPAIVLNGAGIYDYSKEEMLWFNAIEENGIELAKKILDTFPSVEAAVFMPDMIYLVSPKFFGPIMMKVDGLTHEKRASFDDVPKGKWGKIIIFFPPNLNKKIKALISNSDSHDLSFIYTTKWSFDILNSSSNKGNAVLKLAEILGVEQKHTSAIGDYYNDIEMLQAVALPACCAQAPKALHELASFHACHCNKGAVADLLEHIEKNY
ncbi:MAG: HAD hydrolase family protein [Clostridia bacterium]